MAIRKSSKSKVIKEDYQLLEIKICLFIIPGERAVGTRTAAYGIYIKYNKDNKRAGYSLKLSFEALDSKEAIQRNRFFCF